jgi:hypothetical protein
MMLNESVGNGSNLDELDSEDDEGSQDEDEDMTGQMAAKGKKTSKRADRGNKNSFADRLKAAMERGNTPGGGILIT